MPRGFIGETAAEKKAARKLARAQCQQERVRLKHWIPEERARAAKQKAMARESLKVEIARIDAKLQQDIAQARERSKTRTCVNLAAGPIVRRFGPVRRNSAASPYSTTGKKRMAAAAASMPGPKPRKRKKLSTRMRRSAVGLGFAERMAKARAAAKRKRGGAKKAARPRRKR